MSIKENVCADCKAGSAFDYIDQVSEGLTIASNAHAQLIDGAIGMRQESDKLAAHPLRDQEVAHATDITSIFGSIIFDISESKQAIDAVMSSSECSEEAKATATQSCPKLDAIKPYVQKMLSIVNNMPELG